MLHIFLVILKIIGIILAVLLGIIVLLALCLLFWPIRYRVEGQNRNQWEGKARIHYLGPVIWLNVRYQEKLIYKLRIFGIPVLSSDKQERRKGRKKKAAGQSKRTSLLDEEEETEVLSDTEAETDRNILEADKNVPEGNAAIPTVHDDSCQKDSESEPVKEDKPGLSERLCRLRQSIMDKLRSIWEAIKNVCKSFVHLKEIYEDEGVRTGFRTLKSEIWLLLKKIRPRKLKWYVKFGFEDPSATGQVLAALAVLQGMWGRTMHVIPDFEHKVLETEFQFKGFIQGFRLVRLGWKCYFDKDIRYFMEKSNSLRRS